MLFYYLLTAVQYAVMDKNKIRIQNLKLLVDAAGGLTKLAESAPLDADKPINTSYLSQLLNGTRSFGEKSAINMARRLALPLDYFEKGHYEARKEAVEHSQAHNYLAKNGIVSIPRLSVTASMGPGTDQLDQDQIIDAIQLKKDWLTTTIKSMPENMRIITGSGESMYPTFSHGDLLLVDISKINVTVDGVYVLLAHEKLFVKRVRQKLDGSYEVSSDNPSVKTVDILDGSHEIEVKGRVVWAWNGRKI